MSVHSELGSGFQELIYQRALAIELEKNSIPFEREKEVYSLPIGLLINFGAKSLEFKRIYNNKHPLNKTSFNPSLS